MRTRRSHAILFISAGLVCLALSVISLLSLQFSIEKMHRSGGVRYAYCEGWGCLYMAEFEVFRRKEGRVSDETVYLCKFHRSHLHEPLYVPLPHSRVDAIGLASLLLFTSLLFFIPGTRMGIPGAFSRREKD